MKTVDLHLFLTSYLLAAAALAVAQSLHRRQIRFLVPIVVALSLISLNTMVGGRVDPARDYLGLLRYLIRERDMSSLIALGMGFAVASAWIPGCLAKDAATSKTNRSWFEPLLLTMSMLVIVGASHLFLWKEILGVTRHAVAMFHPEFTLEKIATLAEQPLRLAVSEEGDVLICYDYFRKHGAIGGAILRLQPDEITGEYAQKTIAEAPLLARPYGLAIRDGDLYVSRSGFFPRANAGTVTYATTGAITQLKDLDGDGYYEFSHDVVTNLPGIRAPDTMQQNNGIAFAPDGSLFVTCAGAADRTLDEHPWGGTILKYSRDFTNPEVFAKGFRNPWAMAFGPDDALFATDSDVDQNPGDELNHIVQGAHYGHPFVLPNEPDVTSIGFQAPILVGERETVFLGITYATSPNLPADCRNCLYVTDFRQNRVLRVRLEKDGDTYRVTAVDPFASVPSPVDIASTPSGDFFVISRRAQNVYRIRPKLADRE
ncbi:MAG: PQQ-dependent sugar dehydrogenase [Planctomycetales bacterium]|nr:PQQ-dependent sugar dehydrogenase [Planctomycetales bacterium]